VLCNVMLLIECRADHLPEHAPHQNYRTSRSI